MIKKLLTITLSLMMIFTSFVPVFAEGEEVNIVGQYGIVIDKDNGYVDVNDCVIVNNLLDPILDKIDFIEDSYIVDICSKEKGSE